MAAMDDPAFGYSVRYARGIIPCGRCAFFVLGDLAKVCPGNTRGSCQAKPPVRSGVWPEVDSDPDIGHGCGEGLLREEAAPLPPEAKP